MYKRPHAQHGRVQRVERGARGHGPPRDTAGFHGLARVAEGTRPPQPEPWRSCGAEVRIGTQDGISMLGHPSRGEKQPSLAEGRVPLPDGRLASAARAIQGHTPDGTPFVSDRTPTSQRPRGSRSLARGGDIGRRRRQPEPAEAKPLWPSPHERARPPGYGDGRHDHAIERSSLGPLVQPGFRAACR